MQLMRGMVMTVDEIIVFMLADAKCGRFAELAEAAEDVLRAATMASAQTSLGSITLRCVPADELQKALEDANG